MADLITAVRGLLLLDGAFYSAVGGRVFKDSLPQNSSTPSIALTLIDDPSENSHTGPSGLAWARVQIDTWAVSREEAASVSELARRALAGKKRTVNGVSIEYAGKLSERSSFDPAVKLSRRSLDIRIGHSEEV